MGIISFRLPDEDEAVLRRAGIAPEHLAKALVEHELRRLQTARAKELSAKYRRKMPISSAKLVRALRDEH